MPEIHEEAQGNAWALDIDIHLAIFANVFVVNNRAALCDDPDRANATAFTSCAKEETCQRWNEVVEVDVGEKHAVE